MEATHDAPIPSATPATGPRTTLTAYTRQRVRVRAVVPRPTQRDCNMAEFIEVPITREDGSEGLHYVNIEAVSYADSHIDQNEERRTLTVYLDNGYWFTLSGPKAEDLLRLIRSRLCVGFKGHAGDN
jgi:hypothetical protein